MQTILQVVGLSCAARLLSLPISVRGVGTGESSAQTAVRYPGALEDADGRIHAVTFEAPVVPLSDVPSILGRRSLAEHRAVLDMINMCLVLCGPGDVN